MAIDFEAYLALAKNRDKFTFHDGACLVIGIIPTSKEGEFLARVHDGENDGLDRNGRLLYWHEDSEFRRHFDNPFCPKTMNDPFVSISEANEENNKFAEISNSYKKIIDQISWFASDKDFKLITRDEFVQIALANNERYNFLFSDEGANKNTMHKKLDPRKEKSLHCLIAVLANKLDYSPGDPNTVGKLHTLLNMAGINMDKKTIRTNIKKAFDTLNEKRE